MESIDKLIGIIKALRAPGGCPWDRAQTHKSIRGHLVEECAELLESIDLDSPEKMREELGDLLMHIALHCEIADEQRQFNFDDVAEELCQKLVRRHPHVFAGETACTSDDVLKIWQEVKAKEKKERVVGKMFDGIPPSLSALRYALDVAKKADADLLEAAAGNARGDKSIGAGARIFDAVRQAVAEKIEPEGALRDYINAVRKEAERRGI